ncbi:serine hydrolase [Burkholderia vietnamiensis]|uniref:serine hydrolase n=1 Tax=Burkholderia vietnamiensis TaxID=60552 RepID=UPI00158C101D|nr:serine hydrolase [Burkholderia vietnamiensis]
MFFKRTPTLDALGEQLVRHAMQRFSGAGLMADHLGLTLLVHSRAAPLAWRGYAWRGDEPFYPCSIVKVFIMAAVEAALSDGSLENSAEIERAMRDMIRWSSNAATNYLIDRYTRTTGDTELPPDAMAQWAAAREGINVWLTSLSVPEFSGINIAQKLMDDDRYGREAAFVKWRSENHHNRLTSNAAASMFARIMDGAMIHPEASARMARRLLRPRDGAFAATPGAQVRGYLAERLPASATVWSKAGWTGWTRDPLASYRRHDVLHVATPEGLRYTLAVFTEGEAVAADETVLPGIGEIVFEALRQACPKGTLES